MATPEILFPYKIRYLAPLEDLYVKWQVGKEESEPQFVIENIHFEHDPLWNTRFWSIQSAHDLSHPVWQAVEITFVLAQIAWLIV